MYGTGVLQQKKMPLAISVTNAGVEKGSSMGTGSAASSFSLSASMQAASAVAHPNLLSQQSRMSVTSATSLTLLSFVTMDDIEARFTELEQRVGPLL